MAEDLRSQKWLAISFFLVCTLVFVGFIYLILTGSTDRAYQNWMSNVRTTPETQSKDADISKGRLIVMVKDQQINLGNMQLTYRGLSSGVLRLDIVLLELDPQYVYHRQIPVEETRQGIQVSNQRFKIISANRQRLKLALINPSM